MSKEYTEGSTKQTPLDEAKAKALEFKATSKPFSYSDVGLKYSRRYREKFKPWALENGFTFRRTRKSGRGGSQDALFYPFIFGMNGNKIDPSLPTIEET